MTVNTKVYGGGYQVHGKRSTAHQIIASPEGKPLVLDLEQNWFTREQCFELADQVYGVRHVFFDWF